MTDVPAQGALSQFAVDFVSPIDAASIAMELVSHTLKRRDTHVRGQGVRGTRSRNLGRVRLARKDISGQLVVEPNAAEMDWLWQAVLGGTPSAGVTDVANALPEFVASFDAVSKVFSWSGLKVVKAVIAMNSGQPIRWTLDVVGEDETVANAGTFPAVTFPETNFYVCSDVTLTLAAAARKFRSATLTIDNLIDSDRFNNSTTRNEIAAQDRMVQLSVSAPYTSDNTDLYAAAIAGAAGTLVLADGSATYTIAFANCKLPAEGPELPGKGEILLPLTVDCYKSGSDSECKVTKS